MHQVQLPKFRSSIRIAFTHTGTVEIDADTYDGVDDMATITIVDPDLESWTALLRDTYAKQLRYLHSISY